MIMTRAFGKQISKAEYEESKNNNEKVMLYIKIE